MKREEFKWGKLILLEKLPTERRLNPPHYKQKYKYISKAKYRCFCGKEFISSPNDINKGNTRSCGCFIRSGANAGKTHGMSKNRLYQTYNHIKSRCYNLNSQDYKYYGGRGIKMCSKWLNSFETFRDWALISGYKEELTIDRIDVNGNYTPKNCRFVNMQLQAINRRDRPNKTGFPGICKKGNKYNPRIFINNKSISLGHFNTKEEAHQAYVDAKKVRDAEIYKKELGK